ncbi:PREDICTED: F-box protein SKIP22-like isoform X2 [Ipomoea nil]|uniref:F-box protein SKIP22-like isoform X2 n=1 Tax=Ipomoea nil TaxID=35883 RepID=UPI00090149F1|nr:PREDICTED: F-box protein SKIP22-like isoform X2 [Ipomoea nil]
MKLKLRSVENKETISVDVPPSTTLPELKRRLSLALPASSAFSMHSSESIRLSLNKKDELRSSSPDETLEMLGITSDDLIFFAINSNVQELSESQITTGLSPNLPAELTDSINLSEKSPELSSNLAVESTNTSDFNSLSDKAPEMVSVGVGKSFSVPGFLRKVFTEELSDSDGGRDLKLLLIAVHAVLLESGFVRLDPILHKKVPNQWNLTEPQVSILSYSLPEIVDGDNDQNSNAVPTVELKFQTLGKFVIVYGSLSGNSSVHSVQLDKDHLVPFLNVVWSNCGLSEEIAGKDGLLSTSPEKEILEFWRTVKDGLALPLLIELCEKAGFGLPPCFMRLPNELILKILELLPAVDLAKMSSLCSELRFLASDDALWKQKFEEQFHQFHKFGIDDMYTFPDGVNWKQKFVATMELHKRLTNFRRRRSFGPGRYVNPPFMCPCPRHPPPFMGPWQPLIIRDPDPLLPPFDNVPPPSWWASHVPRCNRRGP